jgi:hypothetical protein
LDFESANPSIVKSIKQRDLLNTWLRLYAREHKIPDIREYRPERLEDELSDLVYFDVNAGKEPPQITIQSEGTRISAAYGHTGKGRPQAIASLKTISEDGGFEIRNLMRGNDTLPRPKLRAVIDRDLFHRAPGRIPYGDLIEFV